MRHQDAASGTALMNQQETVNTEMAGVNAPANKSNKKKNGNFRKILRALHRDIGYFCIGMTIIFAVSGLAVNHIEDWNPNYEVSRSTHSINIDEKTKESDSLNETIIKQIGMDIKIRTEFWESENSYKIFAEEDTTIYVNFSKNSAVVESVKKRPILSAFNRLHLNEAHKAWVIFSDIFAVLLLFLACSALFMLKGKKSAFGVKGLWVLGGIFVPGVFFFI